MIRDDVLMVAGDALRYLDLKNLLKPNTLIDGKIIQEALPLIELPSSETCFVKYCLLRNAIESFANVHTSGSVLDQHHINKIESGYSAYSAIALVAK